MTSEYAEHVIEIQNWLDLSNQIEGHASGNWIFRGVTNHSHPLRPKIGRADARKNPDNGECLPYSKRAERKMFDEFCRTARPYVVNPNLTDIHWLAIAQHHGMPTRLLDWSESPLVAAFFASEAAGTEREPPAIIATQGVPLIDDNDPFADRDGVVLYRPPHISPRIPAQSGIFTLHSEPNKDQIPAQQIEKWILVGKSRQNFWLKQILATCGINRASLFPDLDGLAQFMGWRYKWSKFAGIDAHS